MKFKELMIDLVVVIVFLILFQTLILKPNIKDNLIEESTTRLEQDIKNETILQDHYIIYDDGSDNLISQMAKNISNFLIHTIKLIVLLIGDVISIFLN